MMIGSVPELVEGPAGARLLSLSKHRAFLSSSRALLFLIPGLTRDLTCHFDRAPARRDPLDYDSSFDFSNKQ